LLDLVLREYWVFVLVLGEFIVMFPKPNNPWFWLDCCWNWGWTGVWKFWGWALNVNPRLLACWLFCWGFEPNKFNPWFVKLNDGCCCWGCGWGCCCWGIVNCPNGKLLDWVWTLLKLILLFWVLVWLVVWTGTCGASSSSKKLKPSELVCCCCSCCVCCFWLVLTCLEIYLFKSYFTYPGFCNFLPCWSKGLGAGLLGSSTYLIY
jgi:hypothetical protein